MSPAPTCYAFSSTFITPRCMAKRIAAGASRSGNTREISGCKSTPRPAPSRSSASARGNGPHREPISVSSFTTIGQVSISAAPWNVDFSTTVPRGLVISRASAKPEGEPVASTSSE